jgi:hypothetical protein
MILSLRSNAIVGSLERLQKLRELCMHVGRQEGHGCDGQRTRAPRSYASEYVRQSAQEEDSLDDGSLGGQFKKENLTVIRQSK